MMNRYLPSFVLAASLALSSAAAWWVGAAEAFGEGHGVADSLAADPEQPVSGEQAGRLQLIELFTSHGCSSCPPADRLLGDLLQQNASLMALEYHVDYWDSLVHGKDGSWKDPFSKPEFTQRQRTYNAAGLTGRRGVYTPQMVINGQYVAVGSDKRGVQQALRQTLPPDIAVQLHIETGLVPIETGPMPMGGQVARGSSGEAPGAAHHSEVFIRVEADDRQLQTLQGAEISLVRYIDQASTDITGGENNRRQLVNHHVVFDVSSLGQLGTQGPMQYRVEAPAEGEGCIVMVQDKILTPVLAAAPCP